MSQTRSLPLDRPRLLAILNLTPDSFYDGGQILTASDAADRARAAIADGADALDIGGESTRPGAAPVGDDEQIRRVVPAIEAIRSAGGTTGDVPISIDTTRARVAAAALDAGADAVNDTSAGLDDPAMLPLIASRGAGVILMHRLRPPALDQYSDKYKRPPEYKDVAADVTRFLADRAAAAISAGVARDAIVLDPGLGFGKTVEQNLELIRATPRIAALGHPVLSAASRKSFVGRAAGLADSTPADRLAASLAISVAHYFAGASIFRAHDAAAQAQALRAATAVGRLTPAPPP